MYSGTESEEYERTVLMSATVCQLTNRDKLNDRETDNKRGDTTLVLDQNSSGTLLHYMLSLYTKERAQIEASRNI